MSTQHEVDNVAEAVNQVVNRTIMQFTQYTQRPTEKKG